METIKLDNGLSVVYVRTSRKYSVCLSVNVGHVNEPALGIANLFERTLLQQLNGIIPIFGGTMTAYTSGGDELDAIFEKMHHLFNKSLLTGEYIEKAKQLITEQTYDMAPMTMRRMKLAYKHIAFSADLVKTTEEYLNAVNSYTIEDIMEFANKYYTAKNLYLIVSGPEISELELKKLAEEYFGDIPSGRENPYIIGNIYTGGFDRIEVKEETTRLMVGWDITHLCINNSPATNVMMSMFLRCMERAYVDAGFKDVQVDFKVAGYYGLRTMRAYVSSSSHNAKELLNVLIETINRICEVEAPIHRLESSRNIAMTEKLDKYEKSDNRALETAWQIIGRGSMYDVANRINSIYKITAEDVMDIANEVFRRSRPSYIVASPEGDNEYYTLEYLMKAIKTDPGK